MKIKSKSTFQIDIQNQIGLGFYLHFVFRFLSYLYSHFIDHTQFNSNIFCLFVFLVTLFRDRFFYS